MKSTNHQLKYFAWEITKRRSASDDERVAQSLFDAQVDINPHQIEAALFALSNPLSRGVVLADEVGLGKTIEAALVLCQYWAEQRRHLLIICPAALRKQWAGELQEKFNLPAQVLDAKTWQQLRKDNIYNPFDNDKISIISYPFAVRMEHELGKMPWDMVVIDEAHKLKNAHRNSNKTGQSLKLSLGMRKKLLLTATPLQNSLMELYGLSTVIDEQLFGDDKAFRRQYVNHDNLPSLKRRLSQFVQRTLRKDVLEYVPYTKRHALTIPFTPSEEEHRLYVLVNAYLLRESSYGFPIKQRHLITIVLRKLMASSTSAVVATLQTIRRRLQALLDEQFVDDDWFSDLVLEEDLDFESLEDDTYEERQSVEEQLIDIDLLKAEIEEIDQYIGIAKQIKEDKKSYALLTALEHGFAQMRESGAQQKVVIFTESRRTQNYLFDFLNTHGFADKVVAFNGSNTGQKAIYQQWLAKYRGSSRVTGSVAIDKRTAIIDYFREAGEILIATEAAAEGVNLQFCSLVINYDLPWNPQRVEQRIGRCHRYGQQFDVVVINFLNERNAADMRVLELLTEKFKLFDGVFGASNEVLGSIEGGIHFEKRLLEIYNKCRTTEEIEAGFSQLREDLDAQINQKMLQTRELLLEHFDADIHELLKIHKQRAEEQLDRISQYFWRLSQSLLSSYADFSQKALCFKLHTSPKDNVSTGNYQLIRKGETIPEQTFTYRLTHSLGEYVLDKAKSLPTDRAVVEFNYSQFDKKVSSLIPLVGQSGWLALSLLSLDSFAKEEHLILTGVTDSGQQLESETLEWMLRLSGEQIDAKLTQTVPQAFSQLIDIHKRASLNKALNENKQFFQIEQEKIDCWAEDKLQSAQARIDDIKIKIRSLKNDYRQATSVDEQIVKQKAIKTAERQQRQLRQNIFDVEDKIETKRDELIDNLQKLMHQRSEFNTLFILKWHLT